MLGYSKSKTISLSLSFSRSAIAEGCHIWLNHYMHWGLFAIKHRTNLKCSLGTVTCCLIINLCLQTSFPVIQIFFSQKCNIFVVVQNEGKHVSAYTPVLCTYSRCVPARHLPLWHRYCKRYKLILLFGWIWPGSHVLRLSGGHDTWPIGQKIE